MPGTSLVHAEHGQGFVRTCVVAIHLTDITGQSQYWVWVHASAFTTGTIQPTPDQAIWVSVAHRAAI